LTSELPLSFPLKTSSSCKVRLGLVSPYSYAARSFPPFFSLRPGKVSLPFLIFRGVCSLSLPRAFLPSQLSTLTLCRACRPSAIRLCTSDIEKRATFQQLPPSKLLDLSPLSDLTFSQVLMSVRLPLFSPFRKNQTDPNLSTHSGGFSPVRPACYRWFLCRRAPQDISLPPFVKSRTFIFSPNPPPPLWAHA